MSTIPQASEQYRSLVERAALSLATAEDKTQTAREARDAAIQATQALHARRVELEERVRSARAKAASRRLTEAEAADLNLAMLDLTDLPPLIHQSQVTFAEAEQSLTEASRVQALRHGELQQVRHLIQADNTRQQIQAAETALLQALADGWAFFESLSTQDREAARVGPTLWSIWQPSVQLVQAATTYVPPRMPK